MSNPATDETLPETDAAATGSDYPQLVTVSPTHYVMAHEIARGGMGRIRVARDRRLGRRIAIKEMLTPRGGATRRFEREARICARLEHPAIISVHEAGAWPSGEPFFAMKLVSGRSLDEVIAGTATLEERLALLPNVIAVADAIAYAHGERVIHRDLKPKNVLVGGFGETVVIDWGLAKDLDEGEEPPERVDPDAPDPVEVRPGAELDTNVPDEPAASDAPTNEALTHVGSVMGTPAYMPPEQARGDAADERADVYSLGAILHHVLAGKAPTGKGDQPRPSLASVQDGVPEDLLAIVDKAMAFDPAQRYPSARELAEDLRRFQTGQLVGAHRYSPFELLRKWIARNKAPVAVGAIAAGVLIVVGILAVRGILHERERAEQQRALAEQSRVEAEALVDFMLFELHDQLEPIGRLDLLGTVTGKAADYFEGRADRGDHAEQGKRSVALLNIGDVMRAQGNLAGALAQYRAAIAIRERLVTEDPATAEWQAQLIAAHRKVTEVLISQGDADGALADARAAVAIAERLTAAHPDPAWQRELAASHKKVADVLRVLGDADGALAEYRAALAIRVRLVEAAPDDAARKRELAIAHDRVAQGLQESGDLAGALVELRAGLAIADELAAGEAPTPVMLRDGWVFRVRIGDVLLAQEDPAGAIAEFRAALAVASRLAAADTRSVQWQRDLSISHEKIADVLLVQGDTAGALDEYRAALQIAEKLARQDPTNAGWQRDLSVTHERIADVLVARGERAAALVEYRAALAIAEKLAAQDPTNAGWREDLAASQKKVDELERPN